MRFDLHTHTHMSPDSLMMPDEIIAACLERKIDGIAVTDHNTIEGALELRKAAPFSVIVGEEIRTAEGEVIGYFLEDKIPPGMAIEDTISRIKDQGGIVCIPHPFDTVRKSRITPAALERIVHAVDVIEGYNSRNLFTSSNEMALHFARKHGKLISAGSDAHSPREIGSAITNIEPFLNGSDFKKTLANATFSFQKSSLSVHLLTKAVKWGKGLRRHVYSNS